MIMQLDVDSVSEALACRRDQASQIISAGRKSPPLGRSIAEGKPYGAWHGRSCYDEECSYDLFDLQDTGLTGI